MQKASSYGQACFSTLTPSFFIDSQSLAIVFLFLLRGKVDPNHYRQLFLPFLYLVLSFYDMANNQQHLVSWIYEDQSLSNEFLPRDNILSGSDNPISSKEKASSIFLPLSKNCYSKIELGLIKAAVDTLVMRISSELLNFRFHCSNEIIDLIISKFDHDLSIWKRKRNAAHTSIDWYLPVENYRNFGEFVNNKYGSYLVGVGKSKLNREV